MLGKMSDEVVLAERRRRKKWTLNPRGKFWSDDNEKLGQKMLEKMGWSKGKGLGAKEQGMANPILVHGNHENKGLGFEGNPDQWLNHQEDFEAILASLNASNPPEQNKSKKPTSLEERSKSSRSRVHYHKFTRGKDLSKWKDSDLACIFGKKSSGKRPTCKEAEEVQECASTVVEEANEEEVGSVSNQHGVIVIKGGSMADYFAKKWNYPGSYSTLTEKVVDESSDVDERPSFSCEVAERVGFGASPWVSGGCQEVSEPEEKPKKRKKVLQENSSSEKDVTEVPGNKVYGDYSGYMNNFVKSCDNIENKEEVEDNIKRKKKKRKHKTNEKEEEFIESEDDQTLEIEKKKKKKKRKRVDASSEVVDAQCLVSDTEEVVEAAKATKKKKKKRKKELEENVDDYEPKKKKKIAMEENGEEIPRKKKEKRREKRNSNDEQLQHCSKEVFSLASEHRPKHIKAF